jgi:RimJ/RimL family protein N-acetyltransferase
VQAGAVVGLAACDDLPWETRLFGQKWGTLKYFMVSPEVEDKAEVLGRLLEAVDAWGAAHQVECLATKTYSDDIPAVHALERQGFLYMDTNLDYVVDLKKNPLAKIEPPALPADMHLRLAVPADAPELVEVAGMAFRRHFSRYMVDERIPKEQAQSVYAEWMRSSMAGYADWVYMAEIDGRIAGYSVWKKPSQAEQVHGIPLGHYSIAGVHPDYAGRGLFSALTYAGMQLLEGQVDLIEGPTHINNYAVQRGYHKLGWQIVDARHSFHKWLV